MNELPLQELFTRLREAGLVLGIDEYQLLLQSLQGGFGIADKAALKRLCQTLWVKSAEEKSIFEYHFEQVMGSEAVESNLEINSNTVVTISEVNSKTILSISDTNINNIVPILEKLVNKSWQRQILQIFPYVILAQAGIAIALIIGLYQKQPTPTPTPTEIAIPNKIAIPTKTAIPIPQPIIQTTTPTTPTQITAPQTNGTQTYWIFWSLLTVTALGGGYRFLWWNAKRKTKQTSSTRNSAQLSKLSQTRKDEVQVVKSMLQATSSHEKIPDNCFILTSEFFPVTQLQMKQIWRYLRRPVREGKATELDVEATVNQIGHKGLLLEPVLVPPRVNRAELLLLIDQDGSMVPFHTLSHRLVETALGGGRLGSAGIYYFHNCPIEYLYCDPYHQQGELVSNIFNHGCSERTAVLIFSDAGAARGGYSKERYKLTKKFLTQLQQQVRYISWLNPMPRKRWFSTTADEIASLVPMFEISRRGLQDAISVLCGRPTNFEGRRK